MLPLKRAAAAIANARALVTNLRILILDEATCALDYQSEVRIQQAMAQMCKGRRVIIIVHRLSTVRPAHRISVIEKGEIVGKGTHATCSNRMASSPFAHTSRRAVCGGLSVTRHA